MSEETLLTSYLEDGKAFRLAGKFDEADVSFLRGIRACSYQKLCLVIEYAWVAHYRRDWSEALERWAAVSKEFPLHPSGSIGVGRVLLELNRLDEAEEYVTAAMEKFPNDRHLTTVFASIANARQDWSAALRRWDDADALDPHSDLVAKGRGVAIWHTQLDAGDEGAPKLVAIESVQDPETRSLLLGFESLGENCEFGLVQRRFEAESLSLLRWTHTGPDMLAQLLESEFANLGNAEDLVLSRARWGEYFLKDRVYGITFHTWLRDCGANEDAFLRKQAARIRWLREKLLTDLVEGKKTFVYKMHHGATDKQINRIFTAFRSFGDSRMLCIGVAEKGNAIGSVVSSDRNLLRGYLSRVEPSKNANWNIPFDEWLSICRSASCLA
jgi:tetratricopeptide (TPR) repeat protein